MNTSKKVFLFAAVVTLASVLILRLSDKEDRPSSSDKAKVSEANQTTAESNSNSGATVAQTHSQDTSGQPLMGATKDSGAKDSPLALKSVEDLATIVLDTNQDPDFRREALAELTEAGPEAIPLLANIAAKDVVMPKEIKDPHSVDVYTFEFEKGLRFTALEAIDEWAARNVDVRSELQTIINKTRDQDIRFLAFVSLRGVEQGRPGKLTRLIDQMFDEFAKAQ